MERAVVMTSKNLRRAPACSSRNCLKYIMSHDWGSPFHGKCGEHLHASMRLMSESPRCAFFLAQPYKCSMICTTTLEYL